MERSRTTGSFGSVMAAKFVRGITTKAPFIWRYVALHPAFRHAIMQDLAAHLLHAVGGVDGAARFHMPNHAQDVAFPVASHWHDTDEGTEIMR